MTGGHNVHDCWGSKRAMLAFKLGSYLMGGSMSLLIYHPLARLKSMKFDKGFLE